MNRRQFFAMALLFASQGGAVACVVHGRFGWAVALVIVGGIGTLACLTEWSDR